MTVPTRTVMPGQPTAARFSVVIPAHDEGPVIERCLAVVRDLEPGEAEVVVVANGCSDDTAARAAQVPGVRVVELAEAGKAAALDAGDAVTTAYPRIYLDADISLDASALRGISEALDGGTPRVCSPRVEFATAGRPWPVCAFYRIFARLPYAAEALIGLGVYGISAQGRARFEHFPPVTADDLFVQRRFAPHERVVLAEHTFTVETPHTVRDLIAVRTRAAFGAAELAADGDPAHAATTAGTARALLRLVARDPRLLPAAVGYLAVTLVARRRAARHDGRSWHRDVSTRRPAAEIGPAAGIAYLVSQYPKLSHEFIAREIQAVRAAGVPVRTFSVRPTPDDELRTDADRLERDLTTALLARPARVVGAALRFGLRHPLVLAHGIGTAVRTGPRNARSRVWQLFYLAEATLLLRHLRRLELRHLHVHLANNGADIARLAVHLGNRLGRRGAPGEYTWSLAMHGPTEFADPIGSDLAAKVRSAAFVACISEYCRRELAALVEPEHHAKLGIVRMGVDPARYPSMIEDRVGRGGRDGHGGHDGPLRVLFVGRLVPEKAPATLLQAVGLLPPGTVQVRIVGAGPLHDELADQLADLGLQETVQLLGPLGQQELPGQYGWADVFCLPSLAEGLPVVIMEAMATGLPVVSTPVAGIPELVVDGHTGRLVAAGDPVGLARALRDLHRDPASRLRMGADAAGAVLQAHDARVCAQGLLGCSRRLSRCLPSRAGWTSGIRLVIDRLPIAIVSMHHILPK